MEIHKEELKIIDLFRKNILAEFTIKQIMKHLNKKSYNWTYKALTKLSKSILTLTKIGNVTQVRLNLSNPLTITYLAYLDRKEAYKRDLPLINELIENISRKTPYFTLLVTGSYATGTAKEDSDLDIVIITEDERKKKEVGPYITDALRLSGINVDKHILTRKEFYLMLISESENFGKEVVRKHLLFYGADAYYQIIREAIKNGLQSKI
jgi:predicted nucleotidyltransferase